MPTSTLIHLFWGGLGSLVNPFKQERAPLLILAYWATQDGFITNLLIYPSICAVFGCDVRQGIGGDFGFSRRAAEAFLSKPWHPKVEKYGIDIFMTTTVLKKGFSIGEVELPAKLTVG